MILCLTQITQISQIAASKGVLAACRHSRVYARLCTVPSSRGTSPQVGWGSRARTGWQQGRSDLPL